MRIHIAPVGYEIERITLPAQDMKADRVWLLVYDDKEKDKAKGFRIKVEEILKKHKIEFKIKECDIINLYDVLRTMREIIEEESGNDIFINVASGSKIEAIAGMLMGSIFQSIASIRPYYVVPKNYTRVPEVTEVFSFGLDHIEYLPEYHIEPPKKEQIALLDIIKKAGGQITKKRLIEEAVNKKLITTSAKKKNEAQAKYASLKTNYLVKMEDWKLVEEEKDRRNKRVKLTKAGEDMLIFLGPKE